MTLPKTWTLSTEAEVEGTRSHTCTREVGKLTAISISSSFVAYVESRSQMQLFGSKDFLYIFVI